MGAEVIPPPGNEPSDILSEDKEALADDLADYTDDMPDSYYLLCDASAKVRVSVQTCAASRAAGCVALLGTGAGRVCVPIVMGANQTGRCVGLGAERPVCRGGGDGGGGSRRIP
jgi:hypothetical protein